MKKFLTFIGVLVLLGASTFAYASSFPVGGQTYYLSGAGVTATQSTIQLSSFTTADGRLITMTNFGTIGYGTLEPQTSSKIEDVSFTGVTQNANGTATLTGVIRGIDFLYPYGSTSSLMKAHSGGAQFIITNTPEWYYNEFAMQNLSNVFTYPSASSSPATKGYVDSVAFGNIPQASTIAQGVVQLATPLQVASSTANGSAGPLVIPASDATSTFNPATSPLKVVVTNNAGTIDPNFLVLSTSTPIGGNPATWAWQYKSIFTTTGTTTFSVPSGVTLVQATVVAGGGSGAGGATCGSSQVFVGGSGGAGGVGIANVNLVGTSTVQVFVGTAGQWSTFGTNGFFISASPGSNASSQTGGAGGVGSATSNTASTTYGMNIAGQGGATGSSMTVTMSGTIGGLTGGSNMFGTGGAGGNNSASGANGNNYGAGGGSTSCTNSQTEATAGSGAQGEVMLQW